MDPTDPIDRSCFLARSGKPHNKAIAHLAESHSLAQTASLALESFDKGVKDPDLARMLAAIRRYRDGDPKSATYACYYWYSEDVAVTDTNASFFICTPLSGLWLSHRERLGAEERAELAGVFSDVAPWFRKMAASPSLYYPNKCLSDAAMLLATGHVLADETIRAEGRAFCLRYLDYWRRRGTGWGEDHSPVYLNVLLEMTLLIMALEPTGAPYDEAKAFTDALVDWSAFHGGLDAVPSIRGYNFDGVIPCEHRAASMLQGLPVQKPSILVSLLMEKTGYRFPPPALAPTRARRWRTFDGHFSTTHIAPAVRLGTLSHYPLMPGSYMHDDWGLGWQAKPCAFIAGREDYGTVQWLTEDDEGVVRQHEATRYHDWPSRHLFKRAGFHPEVVFCGHQEGGAAILFREIHRVHSPTRRLVDRWRLAHSKAEIVVDGKTWDGKPASFPSQWVLLQYAEACLALRPLACRIPDLPVDDPNPQRRPSGRVAQLPIHLERAERGTMISLSLVEGHEGLLTQGLFFSGWCVVALNDPSELAKLRVTETFHADGELPRPDGELIRSVELSTPAGVLRLVRDMMTGAETRFIDGKEFRFTT
jgi:hypothetical protein